MISRLAANKLVSTWIAMTVGTSIIAMVDGGWLMRWAALAPSRVWHGELWRLATWIFIDDSPLGLILTCATIYKFGGELAPRWGDRRLRRFMADVIGAAGAVTVLVAWLSDDAWYMWRAGGWAVSDALVIAWARQYPGSVLVLYGLVHLNGKRLIAVTIAVNVLFAIYAGPFVMAPELIVCAAAYWYPSARLARRP